MSYVVPSTPEAVERGYNNRAAVPDHPKWFARWAEFSEQASASLHPQLDVRYGPGAKETLDVFRPRGTPRGTLVFIHGGYWRGLDKREHGFVAPPFVAQDIAVANINYDLCPQVSVRDIVEECRRAVAWIVREGSARGLDTQRIVVSGHSAGGHLAAMLHATDWNAFGLATSPIAGSVSLSGVHDLEPILHFSGNVDIRLDAMEARRLSPIRLAPTTQAPIVAAAGANETTEFLRQTQLLWEAWPAHRPKGAAGPLYIAGRHHFDVVLDYADAHSSLTQATLALFAPR